MVLFVVLPLTLLVIYRMYLYSFVLVHEGGVMFKVFVVGDIIKVVRRFSLPNVSSNCEKAKANGVFKFPRVSSAAASADNADLEPSVAELPPKPFLEALVKELRTLLVIKFAASSHFPTSSLFLLFCNLLLCIDRDFGFST